MTANSETECVWGKWRPLCSTLTPPARVGHTAHATHEDSIESQANVIVLGGASPMDVLNEALLYNLVNDKWTQIQFVDSATHGPGLARYEHSSAWLPDGRIFVFGGATQTGPLSDLMQLHFTPGTNQSNACLTLALPTHTSLNQFEYEARTQHSSTCLTECEQILVFAGGALGNQPVSDSRVHMYDIRENRWFVVQTSGEFPCARFGHLVLYEKPPIPTITQDTTCALPRGRLFIHGGMAESKFFDDLYELQFTVTPDGQPAGTWQLLAAQSSPPAENLKTGSYKSLWMEKSEMCHIGRTPCARAAHGGALLPGVRQTDGLISGAIILFGGVSSEGALNDMYCFNTETRQWTEITLHEPVPKPRLDFACCVYTRILREGSDETNDYIRRYYFFVHGGMDTDGHLFDDAWAILLAEEKLQNTDLEKLPFD